jgi:hypothetical protein
MFGMLPQPPRFYPSQFTPRKRRKPVPHEDSTSRKATPIFSGVMRYFPDALAAVARLSKAGNDKHNPGEPLHWSREKSADHGDCIARHQIAFDQIDPESGEYHAAAVAWRALAQLQLLEEAKRLGELSGPMGRAPAAPEPGSRWECGTYERPAWASETTLIDYRVGGDREFNTAPAYDLAFSHGWEYRKHQ